MYGWRNIRVEFTQAMTNKAPVSPNRGYSRMQHLWLTERIADIVAHELGFDRVEVRKRNYVQPEQMPYETPNGCVYDSGDYPRALDTALELIGYDTIEARREEAASRGKLLGLGIGSTLDSGTNNFGQSQLLNPELQFSGNNEVATVKLDIFGEIVVTLGTTPQGQGHETTAAQVVADILGCDVDIVHVRAGHDSYWNSHAGFSGTYASQFAVTGLGAVKGATDELAGQMKTLASMVFQCPVEAIELADGFARIADNHEAALPFMALGAIPNANNAGFPTDPPPMNARFVYRPHFEVPDKERKFGNLTLTYAMQIHACVVEIDPETGRLRDRRLRGRRRLRRADQPADRRGAGDGRDRARDRRGDVRVVRLRRGRQPPDAQLLRLPRAARARHAAAQDRRRSSRPRRSRRSGRRAWARAAAAGSTASAPRSRTRCGPREAAIVTDSHNPYHRVWELLRHPDRSRGKVEVRSS